MPQVWKWTPAKLAILQEVFLGEETQAKIAQKHRMSHDALRAIIRNDHFQVELQKLRDQLEQSLYEADVRYVAKEHRITGLAAMAQSARKEYEARPWLQEKRQIGYDKEHDEPLYMINESFNQAAFSEFRGALADIAKELGHRVTKTEVTGKDGESLMTPVGMAIAAALMPQLGSPQARDVLATALLREATANASDAETITR